LGLWLASGSALASAASDLPRAIGGARLVEAMESSPATVVVVVKSTRPLGGTGFGAVVRVEDPIVGEVAIGTELRIAWEELSASRAPRFAPGERALVVLEPLSGASIWRTRLPDADERTQTLGIAMRGDAFLRGPALGTATLLEHYLALTPEDRAGPDGVAYLAQLAAIGEMPLATDAVARLETRSELDAKLGQRSARHLVQALVREDATAALEDALIELVRRHQLNAMRDPLEALAEGGVLAPPVVYAALAQLTDGLTREQTTRLLAQGPERYREVAVRNAGGSGADRDLHARLRRDPAASVRIGAIERLVELRGVAAIGPVADALADPEPTVRAAAAVQLAGLGADAVPELKRVVEASDPDAARAAIAALALTGSGAGGDALREIAAEHPDPSIRMVARLALGGKVGETHD